MSLTLPPLAPADTDFSVYEDELQQIIPRFFIPRLQEKPQDPIMDALRFERESRVSRPEPPLELVNTVEVKIHEHSQGFPEEDCALFWEHVVTKEDQVQVSQLLTSGQVSVSNAEVRTR